MYVGNIYKTQAKSLPSEDDKRNQILRGIPVSCYLPQAKISFA